MNIIDVRAQNRSKVPGTGNKKEYIAVHYLGVVGQNNKIEAGGYGAHYYIYWDGTVYQAADHDAILWQVGTGGYYTQKHPKARNSNTIGIEMCCKCDGDKSNPSDPTWYFTEATQMACIELVKMLQAKLGIPSGNVLRHNDIVNKVCPAPYVNNNKYKTSWTWDEFKARLSASGGSSSSSSAGGTNDETRWYRIRKSWLDVSSQIGAYKSLAGAKSQCPAGYTVFDWAGKAAYTRDEYPWVGECTGNSVRVRKGPGTGYDQIGGPYTQLNKGNLFDVTGKSGDWYQVLIAKKYEGYISAKYVNRK